MIDINRLEIIVKAALIIYLELLHWNTWFSMKIGVPIKVGCHNFYQKSHQTMRCSTTFPVLHIGPPRYYTHGITKFNSDVPNSTLSCRTNWIYNFDFGSSRRINLVDIYIRIQDVDSRHSASAARINSDLTYVQSQSNFISQDL